MYREAMAQDTVKIAAAAAMAVGGIVLVSLAVLHTAGEESTDELVARLRKRPRPIQALRGASGRA